VEERVVITGSNGRLGREVMRAFDDAGLACTGVDAAATVEFRSDGNFVHKRADLTDYGQTIEALTGSDVVVHLANISYPGFHPDHVTFNQNVAMNYNVFSAASSLGCRRVIWLSSANVSGADSALHVPDRFPITEDQAPGPTSSYALSKSVSEVTAEYFGSSTDTTFVGVRSTLIVYPEDHEQLRADADNADLRDWHYWSYIDVRDLTELLLLAARSDVEESEIVYATAADSILNCWTADHCARHFPGTPCEIAANTTQSLFSGDKAKQLFGFEPRWSWRQ
jgi:nucleoside-diphosphate-sugar epimerase